VTVDVRLPTTASTRIQDEVATVCQVSARTGHEFATVGLGGQTLEAASQRIGALLQFDGACWFGTDPATIMPTTPVHIENVLPGHCELYWETEYADEDVLMFRDLARSPEGGGSLVTTTDGMPYRSKRYRELLAPRGYGDHLRAAIRLGDSTWGVVDLFRNLGREPFNQRDVELVTAHGHGLATALAGLATRDDRLDVFASHDGPGTAIYDESGALSSLDDLAQRWLGELTSAPWHEPATHPLMAPVWSLLGRARSVAEGRDRGPATVRIKTATGRWLILQASCLRTPSGGSGQIAVVIGPATSAQIAPLTIEAYGLTPREKQVTHAVARGLTNPDIAAEIYISVHTVRDHLKAVFAKMDVTSRGELVAKIFTVHYAPALDGTHV
jgi:DNA-binding CsgD family transcriptional regulator